MPAPRSEPNGILHHLNQQAPRQQVNNILSIDRYYKSADLAIAQARTYREARNEEQLYVMLIRFASLVLETISKHKDFQASDRRYQAYEKLLRDKYLGEVEQLKRTFQLRDVHPTLRSSSRPSDAQQISYSNLPQMDWSFVVTPNTHPPSTSSDPFAASATQPPLFAPPTAQPSTPYSPYGPPAPTANAAPTTTLAYTPSSTYGYASQATLNRHSLFAPSTTSTTYSSYAPPSTYTSTSRPLSYPTVDTTPIDLLSLEGPPPSASAPPASLLDAPPYLPSPSAGPSIGPQEVEVNIQRPTDPTPDTCACPPPPSPDALATAGPAPTGVKEYTKRAQLRDVHVSVALMEEFLRYAQASTRNGIESCGILAGRLSANDSTFTITTLIIPKQQGTSDTVQALNEEEIFEVQMSRELYPMGWIHTHPTQTCFLSSVDVHTQCGYQTMLDEAVAIVMAPSDRKNKCGIFRLSTPGGLALTQKCGLRGFHHHPPTDNGQELYELSGHVYLNPRTKHDVVDLR